MEGSDYDRLWKRELGPMLGTSLLNRCIIEQFGAAGYRYLARRLASTDPCAFLKKHYNDPSASGSSFPSPEWRCGTGGDRA